MEKNNKMGRPTTPEYRKKRFRFSAIEDTFKEVLGQIENEKDRKLIIATLEKMKAN